MVNHLISAGVAPVLGITAIAATVASTLHFASPAPAPSLSSPSRATSGIMPLTLERNVTDTTWTSNDDGGGDVDIKLRITGEATTAVGSYSQIRGWAYCANTTWVYSNAYAYRDILLPPDPAYCWDIHGSQSDYDQSMNDIVIDHDQFLNLCSAAENAAITDTSSYCTDQCGVHDFMQPMLWPSAWSQSVPVPGVVEFQKYFRLITVESDIYRGCWSRVESPKKYFTKQTVTQNYLKRQSAQKNVPLPDDFFNTQNTNSHPNYRDAVVDGDLHVVFQVVSLQGDQMDPLQFPPDNPNGDPQSDAQGPPGLTVHPSSSTVRTSNALHFDLGGTAGGPPQPHYSMSAVEPPVHTMVTAHRGGTCDVDLTPVYYGAVVHLERQGFPSVNLTAYSGPDSGTLRFGVPITMTTGTWWITSASCEGYTTTLWGNNSIGVIVIN